jgi:hypothetical protein
MVLMDRVISRFLDFLWPVKPLETHKAKKNCRIAMDNPMYLPAFRHLADKEDCIFLSGNTEEIMEEVRHRHVDVAVISSSTSSDVDPSFRQIHANYKVKSIMIGMERTKVDPITPDSNTIQVFYKDSFARAVQSLFEKGVLTRQ